MYSKDQEKSGKLQNHKIKTIKTQHNKLEMHDK